MAYNQNSVEELNNPDRKIEYGPFSAPSYSLVNGMVIKEGNPLTSFWGYDFVEVREGEEYFRNANGDVVSSNAITPNDRIITGQVEPNLTYGLTLNFRYRNFDMG